jgi:hypothetical protein
LAEAETQDAVRHPRFDEELRPQRLCKPESERCVFDQGREGE